MEVLTEPKIHDRLFNEISSKLNELEQEGLKANPTSSRLEQIEFQFRRSQEELALTRQMIEEKMTAFASLANPNTERQEEMSKVQTQLETERAANAKLAGDLTKSIEVNLNLQIQIEELKKMARQAVEAEKRKHEDTTRLNELQKINIDSLSEELSQVRLELTKTSEAYNEIEKTIQEQSTLLRELSNTAEAKIVEMQLELNKRLNESKDYYSHLQRSYQQIQLLKQENQSLRDYFSKMQNL